MSLTPLPPMDALLRQIDAAAMAGAVMPLARLWCRPDLGSGAEHAVLRRVQEELGHRVAQRQRWPAEEAAALALMSARPGADRWVLEQILHPGAADGWHAGQPGRVALLTAPTTPMGGEWYGAAACLTVHATRWAGRDVRRFERGAGDPGIDAAAERAVSTANDAVDALLLSRGRLGPAGAIAVMRWGRVVRIAGARLPVEGESLALAAAVAIVSAIANVAVPDSWGFSGALEAGGALTSVGGIGQKLAGARDKGLTDVVIPAGCKPTADTPGVRVHGVRSLAEALDLACPGMLEAAVAHVVAESGMVPSTADSLASALARSEGHRRVLVSMIGNNDPYGRRAAPHDTVSGVAASEEGPLLAIAAAVRPDVAWLMHTSGPQAANDKSAAAESVERHLRDRQHGIDVRRTPLPPAEVADPTDYPAIMRAIARALRSVRDALSPDGRPAWYFVNVTSGTPQMQTVLHLLRDRGLPAPDATLIQVRETERLEVGESRLRAVDLPTLDA